MNRISCSIFLLVLLPLLLFGQNSPANWRQEILVQINPELEIHALLASVEQKRSDNIKWSVKKELAPSLGYYLLSCETEEEGNILIAALQQQPGVRMAMYNYPVEFRDSIPNDPLFSKQWDMKLIGLPDVWSATTGGHSANGDEIVVAILDKGFDLSHEDLIQNVWINKGEIPGDSIDNDGNGFIDDMNGWNFRTKKNTFSLETHGTWVSGIIGAKGNNGKGPAGVNWNIKLMFLAIEYADEVVSAFNYILTQRELYNATGGKKGSFVVATNGSFGINKVQCSSQPAWGGMYDPMGAVGVLSVAATANENWDVDELGDIPTSCPSEFLISVTSTDEKDVRVSNAAYGKKSIDLGAPGKNTVTTNTLQRYKEDFGGTSAACPHVAGTIGLLYSVPCKDLANLAISQPKVAAQLIRDAIYKGVDQLSSLKDKTVTGGRLNAFKAMQYLHTYCIARPEERSASTHREIYFSKKGIVRVYPNPASAHLNIDFSNDSFSEVRVRIFNSLGQEVRYPGVSQNAPFTAQRIVIDVENWARGAYFINLIHPDEKITLKFLKL